MALNNVEYLTRYDMKIGRLIESFKPVLRLVIDGKALFSFYL